MGKMTEQEKMKQGYLWKDDEENMALQARAKELIKKFNDLPSDDMKGRENILHDIFGNVVVFGTACKVYREIDEHDEEYYFKNRRFEDQPEE